MKSTSLNARVAAISFPLGATGIHVLNQLDASLLPLRILFAAVLIFGVWSFSDEMGLRKPLNRAAFISCLFAIIALLLINLQIKTPGSELFLIYAFGLLGAVLIWSAAFLHRQKSMQKIGAFGALASALPVLILIGGHLSIGFGAAFGIGLLFELPAGDSAFGTTPLNVIEAVFVLWALIAGVSLWLGAIRRTTPV